MNLVDMPLAGSLIDVASRASEDVSVIVNSDIMLTQSLPDAIGKIREHFTDWFLSGARLDVTELPHMYEPTHPLFSDGAFTSYARTKGILHTAGGQDYFIWNNNGRKLIEGIIPPFIRGKSKCTLKKMDHDLNS